VEMHGGFARGVYEGQLAIECAQVTKTFLSRPVAGCRALRGRSHRSQSTSCGGGVKRRQKLTGVD
jgi:hypothetical protein